MRKINWGFVIGLGLVVGLLCPEYDSWRGAPSMTSMPVFWIGYLAGAIFFPNFATRQS